MDLISDFINSKENTYEMINSMVLGEGSIL